MENFCGLCRPQSGCREYSTPPQCVPRETSFLGNSLNSNKSYCESFGFSFNPLAANPCVVKGAATEADCFPNEFCSMWEIQEEADLFFKAILRGKTIIVILCVISQISRTSLTVSTTTKLLWKMGQLFRLFRFGEQLFRTIFLIIIVWP